MESTTLLAQGEEKIIEGTQLLAEDLKHILDKFEKSPGNHSDQ
jgi:hypothetical protein